MTRAPARTKAETTLAVPQGRFEVRRLRHGDGSGLRAWDAADEYVLDHLAGLDVVQGGRWVIQNDSAGALAAALADRGPTVVSDSVLAQRAIAANLERNGVVADAVPLVASTEPLTGSIDVLVLKVPKSLALLEDQLHRVRSGLHAGSVVVGAGMTKNIHTSTLQLFESLVGPTTTSLARKKARLAFSTVDLTLQVGPSPYPTTFEGPSGHRVVNHANVFSRGRLDIGTRLLVDHLPTGLGSASVVDLGCGNGVIGLTLAVANPDASVTFIDSSHMAVASAEATMASAFGDQQRGTYLVGDGLESIADGSIDLVVLNPPFHDDRARTYDVAWQMFTDSRRALRAGGELLVVGNRHLGYHAKLGRLFGKSQATLVSGNSKFVVLSARR